MDTPVVLLLFNRPDLVVRVLERIRSARPTHLIAVADGPRDHVATDRERCAAARAVIEGGVDWPCELIREYADSNLGCARRVSSGLDSVFTRFSEAIILEDDCVPDPTFFRFCEELLQRYRDVDRVGVISGDNFQLGQMVGEGGYYFSRYPHCWGWATWRRAWNDYDHGMAKWRRIRRSRWLETRTQSRPERRFWKHAFDCTAAGRIDSWAFRWTLACWLKDRVAVLPSVNLVSNIGYRTDATHTTEQHPAGGLPAHSMPFPLRHPEVLSVDDAADRRTAKLLFHRGTLISRLFGRLVRPRSR